ncbi:hypothetical protein BaRGS_00035369, partial [Batillaria attramentaria]
LTHSIPDCHAPPSLMTPSLPARQPLLREESSVITVTLQTTWQSLLSMDLLLARTFYDDNRMPTYSKSNRSARMFHSNSEDYLFHHQP